MRTMAMTTRKIATSAALFAAALAGCGGAQKTSAAVMTEQARNAEPPPENVTEGKVVVRKVSGEISKDFAAAVSSFQAAAEGGYTLAECRDGAAKFESVASDGDKLVEGWFNAGVAYQLCGMMKEAEAVYLRALKANESHAPTLANLGEVYLRGGNLTVAKQYFDKALQADGTTVAAYVNLGYLLFLDLKTLNSGSEQDRIRRDDLAAQARRQLQLALAVDNRNVVARTLMALIFLEGADRNRNQLDLATLLLDAVVKGKPVLDEGASDERKKKYEHDLLAYERDISYPPLHHAYGLIALERGNVGKAIRDFEQAIKFDPDFVEARLNLAQIVVSFRKYKDAETHFEHVLRQTPGSYDATIGLAVALRGQGRGDDAERLYKVALGLDGKRPEAYYDLGLLWLTRTGTGTGEVADYERARNAWSNARDFFVKYKDRGGAKAVKAADADDNIKEAETGIKYMDEAIVEKKKLDEDAKNPPPAPPPEPAPVAPADAGASPAPPPA